MRQSPQQQLCSHFVSLGTGASRAFPGSFSRDFRFLHSHNHFSHSCFTILLLSSMCIYLLRHQFCTCPYMPRDFSLQYFFRLPVFPVHSRTAPPSPCGIRMLCVLLRVFVVRAQVQAGRDVSGLHLFPLRKFLHVCGLRVRMERS